MSINLAKSTSCCYFYIMKDNHTPPEVVPEDEHEKAKQSALKKQGAQRPMRGFLNESCLDFGA